MASKTVMVANRGEIACRIMRACRSLGLRSLAVFAPGDAQALHVETADVALPLVGTLPSETYLDIDQLIAAARRGGADAVHPGYGFLSENARFARAVLAAGLTWIGPDPDTIEAMGDKARARALAKAAGIPVLKGTARFDAASPIDLVAAAQGVGYPLLVKATGGGGGIGMKVVTGPDKLASIVAATQAQAQRLFGDSGVTLEPYLAPVRHVEVQIFGFGDGRAVHLFERDCSIQRRFQKVVEEAPAPDLPTEVSTAMALAAVTLAERQRYAGAGTAEFLYHPASGRFFFLEMNTRIQVEHPVTEAITGIDLVALQIRLATGHDLSGLTQDLIGCHGHAIEVRLCAEDPRKAFRPSPGTLRHFRLPAAAEGLRIDTGYREGDTVSPLYDSLLAKIVAWGETREIALARLSTALAETGVDGLASNRDALAALASLPAFAGAALHTGFLDEHGAALMDEPTRLSA